MTKSCFFAFVFQELPTLDRAIVLLHLEDRSYDEIAEITGLSRSNVSVPPRCDSRNACVLH